MAYLLTVCVVFSFGFSGGSCKDKTMAVWASSWKPVGFPQRLACNRFHNSQLWCHKPRIPVMEAEVVRSSRTTGAAQSDSFSKNKPTKQKDWQTTGAQNIMYLLRSIIHFLLIKYSCLLWPGGLLPLPLWLLKPLSAQDPYVKWRSICIYSQYLFLYASTSSGLIMLYSVID